MRMQFTARTADSIIVLINVVHIFRPVAHLALLVLCASNPTDATWLCTFVVCGYVVLPIIHDSLFFLLFVKLNGIEGDRYE